jgi:flagellar hook-associated protein 2
LTIDLGTISGGTFDSVTGTYSGAGFTPNAAGSVNVTIDNSNNTLEGIRDAINAADAGVTATIVNDGNPTNPYRLVLSSENSGIDQSARIAVTGDATLSALLSHDPAGTQNFSENVTAQNALFTVDGISITKSSNKVTDVIDGVTLDLLGETSGTPVTVSVSQDTDSAKNAIEEFVNSYNDFIDLVRKETASGVDGGEAGALASDSATRQMETSLRSVLGQAPTGITGAYANLSSIGVEFQRDGKLSLDETKLSAAIQADSSNVEDLFSSTDGYATRLDTVVSEMLAFNGTIDSRTNGYKDRISSLEDRQVTLESGLERTELRLRTQFTKLDVLMANMNATSSFLTQQLDILNAQTSGG